MTAEGEILQIGSPSDVYLHPATPFVAGFLGETNLLPGTCRGVEHGHIVVQVRSGELGRARTPRFASRPAAGNAVLASIRPERLRIPKADEAADSCMEGKGRQLRLPRPARPLRHRRGTSKCGGHDRLVGGRRACGGHAGAARLAERNAQSLLDKGGRA